MALLEDAAEQGTRHLAIVIKADWVWPAAGPVEGEKGGKVIIKRNGGRMQARLVLGRGGKRLGVVGN